MATLLDRQLRTSRTISVTAEHAHAMGNPIRSKILSMLYGKTLSAEEITAAINKTGSPKKAPSTVRHHIDVLKTTGLIEVTRIVESRGGITKYYGTSTRLLDFETPDDFESAYSSLIDSTTKRLEDILDDVLSDVSLSIAKPTTAEYSVYLVVDIMNRAITKVLEKGKRRGTTKAPLSSKKAAKRGKKVARSTVTNTAATATETTTKMTKSRPSDNRQGIGKQIDND